MTEKNMDMFNRKYEYPLPTRVDATHKDDKEPPDLTIEVLSPPGSTLTVWQVATQKDDTSPPTI